ncbi:SDR family NAD(P)-dependent oxidoreductase [Saccharibacillus kuerlensis]|uniref:Short-chain dehydrogenase n=1 Tax=Saccharibacillus kuerlensis TaxID=459527 RepID=A0ABQ2L2N7_9BACL|nr:glucose 1-dehydrogenase [Saccharibacillus kuerlensis]GGO00003.1 short-chain dehydrogenase [Saccharibacillus kuerlensis]
MKRDTIEALPNQIKDVETLFQDAEPTEEGLPNNFLGRLSGKRVLVTGAGRGIGAKVAESFAREGASLVITEVPSEMERLNDVAYKLQQTYGRETKSLALDIRSSESIAECAGRLKTDALDIDYLVNNAGVNMLVPALEVTPQQWDLVMDINLKGTFFLTQQIAKGMVKRRNGSIVMLASQHGVVANENRAPYCASKAGLVHLTKALALEWAKYGIRVNAVSPTFVATEANREHVEDPRFRRMSLPKIPLRKLAVPSDIAEAVLFLASEQAGMITGHNLIVDGGWTVA